MSVYRHKHSPFWQFDFQRHNYRFSGSTGVSVSRPKAEALAVEAQERRAAERLVGEIAETGRRPLTFGACADRWWLEHGQYLAGKDLQDDVVWLKARIGPATRLHEITDDTVASLVAERRQHRVRAGTDAKGRPLWRPISPRTVNLTVVFLLRRILRRARDLWNAVILREPKWAQHALKAPRRSIRPLSHADEQALDAAEDADFAALRRFAIITGLRRREVLLTWPQVDFTAATVAIIGKGGRPRLVPLSAEAYALLWAQRGRHREWVWTYVARKTRACPKTKRKLVRGTRYPITYSGIGSNKKRRWAQAGVAARWHDTRHTAGTRMLRTTGNLKLAQMLLGHSDIKTTAEFYADVLLDDVRAGMDATAAQDHAARTAQSAGPDAAPAERSGTFSGTLRPGKSP